MFRLAVLVIFASVSAGCSGSVLGRDGVYAGSPAASLLAARDSMGGYGLGGLGAASMGARDAGLDAAYGRGFGDFGFGGLGGYGGYGSPYGSRLDLGGFGPFGAGSYLGGRDAAAMGSMGALGSFLGSRDGAYSPAAAAAVTASRDSVTVSNPLGAGAYTY